jgi:LAGLIDADG endonuclease
MFSIFVISNFVDLYLFHDDPSFYFSVSSLVPWFVTGYTDAEGCFFLSIFRSKTHSLGWAVKPKFAIGAENNPANRALLEQLKIFFGGGRIYLSRNQLYYEVTDLPTLLRIRDHFLKFPLQSTKWVNFQLWSRDMMVAKQHLTRSGLLSIVAIQSHFPNGLSPLLTSAFPKLPSVYKPEFIPSTLPLDPNWIAGFVNGDGSFSLG